MQHIIQKTGSFRDTFPFHRACLALYHSVPQFFIWQDPYVPSLSFNQWVVAAQAALGHNTGLSRGLTVISQVYWHLVLHLDKLQPHCNFRFIDIYIYRHFFRLILWGCAILLALILSHQRVFLLHPRSKFCTSPTVPRAAFWSLMNSCILIEF